LKGGREEKKNDYEEEHKHLQCSRSSTLRLAPKTMCMKMIRRVGTRLVRGEKHEHKWCGGALLPIVRG